jgi:hypothetical protein
VEWRAREDLKRDLHFALLLKNSKIGCLHSRKQASCYFAIEPKCKDAQNFCQQMSADFPFQTLFADSSTAAFAASINSRNCPCRGAKKHTPTTTPTPPKIKSSSCSFQKRKRVCEQKRKDLEGRNKEDKGFGFWIRGMAEVIEVAIRA